MDSIKYLKEIRNSIIKDIRDVAYYHARRHKQKNAGHFSIPREVFSIVDHLGFLAYGDSGSTARAVKFIKEFFPDRYFELAELVYAMWRQGTIHQFKPISYHASSINGIPQKVIVKWVSTNHNRKKERQQNMLCFPMEGKKNTVYIVINVCQLSDDLLIALDNFIQQLKKNKKWEKECQNRIKEMLSLHDLNTISGKNRIKVIEKEIKSRWPKKGGILDQKLNVIKKHPDS